MRSVGPFFGLLVAGIVLFKVAVFVVAAIVGFGVAGVLYYPVAWVFGVQEKSPTEFATVNFRRLWDTGVFEGAELVKHDRELDKQREEIRYQQEKVKLDQQKAALGSPTTPSPDSFKPSTWGDNNYSDPTDVLSHLPSIYDRLANDRYCDSLKQESGYFIPYESGRSRSLSYAGDRGLTRTANPLRTECRRDGRWYTVRLFDNGGYDLFTKICPAPPPCTG